MKKKYYVEGMTCSSCQVHVEKAVSSIKGVKEAKTSLVDNSLSVEKDDSVDDKKIERAIKKAGYSLKGEKDNSDKSITKQMMILVVTILLMIPLFYLSMGYMMDFNIGVLKDRILLLGLIEFILSISIMFLNRRFFVSGFRALINLKPNMDSLIALGSSIAFIYSLVIYCIMLFSISFSKENNLQMIHHYSMNLNFETAGMIPAFISIGKFLESLTMNQSKKSIEGLKNLVSSQVVCIKDGKEVIIDVDKIQEGDILLIKKGESFPVDGIICEGKGEIDESSLTGESVPVYKEEGMDVLSSTIALNNMKIKATKVGKNTTLNRIIDLVKDSSLSKGNITRIVDKVSYFFVPTIIILSVITFLVWFFLPKSVFDNSIIKENQLSYAFSRAISVLVIACPCSLGLATPVSIMISTYKGSRNGILFKDALQYEQLNRVSYVIFDKTGTLTKGKMKVKDIYPYNIEKKQFMEYVYSLENNSNHPLAASVVKYMKENNISLLNSTDFVSKDGEISCFTDDKKISSYPLREIEKKNILLPEKLKEIVNKVSLSKEKPLLFFIDDKPIGIISLEDEIKEDAKKAIEEIKKMNKVPVLLSGDNQIITRKIAESLGIDIYYGEMYPDEKLKIIQFYQKHGKVCMVGDGINDAPSLMSADVSISYSSGSDLAIDSSNIVVLKDDVKSVVSAFNLSIIALRNIKENLLFAFFYNLVMIPIAAGVFFFTRNEFLTDLKPYYGAICMSLSSISVVLNALRINLYSLNKNRVYHKKHIEKIMYEKDSLFTLILKIDDMMCEKCEEKIREVLLSLPYVKSLSSSLSEKTVTLEVEKKGKEEEIKDRLFEIDYNVKEYRYL